MKHIKHIAAALVLAFIAPTMSAQIYQSKSYIKKTTITKEEKKPDVNPWKKCQWYGRMGVLIPVSVDYGEAPSSTIKPTAGFDLDFGFKLRMGRHGWYWGMDLAMYTAGVKVSDGTHYDNRGHLTTRKGGTATAVGGRLGLTSFGWRARFSDFTTDINVGLAVQFNTEATIHNKGYFDKVSMCPAAPAFPIGLGVAYKKITFDLTMFIIPPVARVDYGYYSMNYSDFRIAVGYLF